MAFGKCDSCEMLRAQIERMTRDQDEQRVAWANTAQENKIRWAFEQTARERMEAKYDDLLAKYHELRVGGANPAEERKGLAPAERSLKPADQAIETQMERWGNNPLLRKRLQRYVHEQRTRNIEEETIAHSVLHWGDPEEESA